MNTADTVNHWDVPVTEHRPREAVVRVAQRVDDGLDDPDTELWAIKRAPVTVWDFYRNRADRAAVQRRYA